MDETPDEDEALDEPMDETPDQLVDEAPDELVNEAADELVNEALNKTPEEPVSTIADTQGDSDEECLAQLKRRQAPQNIARPETNEVLQPREPRKRKQHAQQSQAVPTM